MNIDDSEILTTKSINSGVYDGGGELVGHIMLLDWDNTGPEQAKSMIDGLPGVTALFQSSEGSMHAWNLSVDDLKTTACRMVLQRDDPNHIRNGLVGDRWRLRIAPKVRNGGKVYKEAPELVTVAVTETDIEQSRPHMDVLTALHGVPEPPNELNWVGDSVGSEAYATMTDRLKKKWREANGADT